MKYSSLAAMEFSKMIISSVPSNEYFLKIITFPFRWYTPASIKSKYYFYLREKVKYRKLIGNTNAFCTASCL